MSSPAEQITQLRASIAALEAQRAVLGHDVVATLVASINHKLEALQGGPPEQQRKQVTILLADLSGFTAMAEMMDAEEVARVMNDLWVMLDSVIVNHGGRCARRWACRQRWRRLKPSGRLPLRSQATGWPCASASAPGRCC